MLIQFSIDNFKTFAQETKLSLIASHDDTRWGDNTVEIPKFHTNLLKSAVIYGANASGKTKLVEALHFMQQFIFKSADSQSHDKIKIEPFRLNTQTEQQSTSFELLFVLENELYRYGFELTKEKIAAEWLFHRPKTKEIELFYREEQQFELHNNFKVRDLVAKNRIKHNSLLLSVADKENDPIARKIFKWLGEQLSIIWGLREQNYMGFSMSKLTDKTVLQQVLHFLKKADLGIEGLIPQTVDWANIPEQLRFVLQQEMNENEVFIDVLTQHRKYNEQKDITGFEQFSMDNDESSGTRKFFALSVPVLQALQTGQTLVVDELDAKLHPILVHQLVELFNSKQKNPNNAQLIFNTHDTNLLSSGLFRRDQIWFTEKDRYGAASLYSLADFKTDAVRKEENFEKNYIKGKYGAIPFLGGWEQLDNTLKSAAKNE